MKSEQRQVYDATAYPTQDCGRKAPETPFVVLDPGKSTVGTSFVCDQADLAQTLLRSETTNLRPGAAGYVPIEEIERRFRIAVEVPYIQDGRKDQRDPPLPLD